MRTIRLAAAVAIAAGFAILSTGLAASTPEQPGRGGQMMGMGNNPANRADMELFHYLLENRAKITRTVTNLPNGIDTTTKSDDAEVAAKLKAHVASMGKRMETGQPIHVRDPFFAEMFKYAKQVDFKMETLPHGVRVIETSADAYVVKLLQEHARIVDLFIQNGMSEMHKDHALPAKPQ